MHCTAVQAVWFSSPLGIHIPSNVDLMEWMNQWLFKDDALVVQLFGITLWRLWQGRNQTVFSNVKFDPVQTALSPVVLVEEFNLANKKPVIQPSRSVAPCWNPPELGTIKINVDAGCFSEGSTGWGFIARDHLGEVLFSATRKEPTEVTPLMAETLGIRWCLLWAEEKNCPKLIVESDAELVILCLKGKKHIAAIEFLIQDCQDIMSRLCNCNVVFVSRNCNLVAHNLVVLAKSIGCRIWLESYPHQIYPSLCKHFSHH